MEQESSTVGRRGKGGSTRGAADETQAPPPTVRQDSPTFAPLSGRVRSSGRSNARGRPGGGTFAFERQNSASSLLRRRGIDLGQDLASGQSGARLGSPGPISSSSSSSSSLQSTGPSLANMVVDGYPLQREGDDLDMQAESSTDKQPSPASRFLSSGSMTDLGSLRDSSILSHQFSHTNPSQAAPYLLSPPLNRTPNSDRLESDNASTFHSSLPRYQRPFQSTLSQQTAGGQVHESSSTNLSADAPSVPFSVRSRWNSQGQIYTGGSTHQVPLSSQQPTLLPPPSASVSGQRPSSNFLVPPFEAGQGEGHVPTESGVDGGTMDMMGMEHTNQSVPVGSQTFDSLQAGQQMQVGSGPYGSRRFSYNRVHSPSDLSLVAPSSHTSDSDWNTNPMRFQMRELRGPFTSSTSGASHFSSSTSSDASRSHQSRATLQKTLRQLEAEMVDLKERVRVAETMYREASPGQQVSYGESARMLATAFGLGHSAENVASGDPARIGQYGEAGGSNQHHVTYEARAGHSEVTSSGGDGSESTSIMPQSGSNDYPSNLPAYPRVSSWRQQQPFIASSQSVAPLSSTTGVGSNMPARRGTWRTGEGSNILVFNTAGTPNLDPVNRTGSREEGGDEEEEGDEQNKRYQCIVPGCLKTFTTSGHARRHSRTHLGHKLFVCPHQGCESTFTRRDNCRQHQRARHHLTLPVHELNETETWETLILDRQSERQTVHHHQHQHQQQQ